ncbi:MAG: sigma-54-dependent Fis family transcriptional regulator [Deltaproteobacteria bacterium]|nr:sigma-54-dependent Fis family transcriptional regulator [Deltaproteobacteria bacterium]
MKILIVDDQRSARQVLRDLLAGLEGIELGEASSLEEACSLIQSMEPDLLLVDIRLSHRATDRGGLDLLRWVEQKGLAIPAVVVTCSTELHEIREAMRLGAKDYVLKDELCPEMLLPIVQGLREKMVMAGEVRRLREQVDSTWGLRALVGSSPQMQRVRRLIERVAGSDAAVLIRGETGTGKELVARALHNLSPRRDQPFLAVNCSALPGTLIESLIFGHMKGAFTGADRRVRGHFEVAGEGTVLLDEIAEMPGELQAKLLRVLEDRRFRPLGAESELLLRARVLAATNVDLEQRMHEGRFREDLFFRLNVVSIVLPPLAERGGDLIELLAAFAAELPRKLTFTTDAVEWLRLRRWPGNVRELRNLVERLNLLAEHDEISASALDELVEQDSSRTAREVEKIVQAILTLPTHTGSKLDLIERAVLHHAIETSAGNKSAAARMVGVDRRALDRRLRRLTDGTPPPGDENDEDGSDPV